MLNCVLYGYTTANGAGIMYVKAPGQGSYSQISYDPGYRSGQRTVQRNGDWGASAESLLKSVTYA